MKGRNGIEEAQGLNDPMVVVREIANLVNLYKDKLAVMSQFADPTGKNWNSWDVRSKVLGFYYTSPMKNWMGTRVWVEGLGHGTVIAVQRVGSWYIPGVEFDSPVEDGHALNLRSEGREGQEGFCLWVWLDRVKIIPGEQDGPAT